MCRIGSQKGEGKAGSLFRVLLLLIGVLVGSKVIPVKIATMQLEDFMKEMALNSPRKPQSFFEKQIGNRARELELKIPKDQIQVKKHENRVIMDVQFTVPLDFYLFQHDWDVKIYQDLDIFLL